MDILDVYKIKEANNRFRRVHFLAQCHHESMGFKILEENLNYSAKGLRLVFGKYYPVYNDTLKEARKPQLIANRVYGGRMGNVCPNDGYKFRGRGCLMITGKYNYSLFSKYIGIDCIENPDLVKDLYALESAAWFFTINNLWKICDEGINEITIKKLTKRINGGYNGLEDRVRLTKEYYANNDLK